MRKEWVIAALFISICLVAYSSASWQGAILAFIMASIVYTYFWWIIYCLFLSGLILIWTYHGLGSSLAFLFAYGLIFSFYRYIDKNYFAVAAETVHLVTCSERGWSRCLSDRLIGAEGLYFIQFDDGLGKWGKSRNLKRRLADYDRPDKKTIQSVFYKICPNIDERERLILRHVGQSFEKARQGNEYFHGVSESIGRKVLSRF